MPEDNQTLATIQALGANAWYVLGIMLAIGLPAKQAHVAALAKLSPNTLTQAIAMLTEHRLIVRVNRYAIQATPHARQLVLGTSIIEAPDSPLEEEEEIQPAQIRLIPPPPDPGTSNIEAPDQQSVLAALDAAGIGEPARSQLAALPHITPDYIAAHVAQAERDGGSLGMAIWRMQKKWRAPKQPRARYI